MRLRRNLVGIAAASVLVLASVISSIAPAAVSPKKVVGRSLIPLETDEVRYGVRVPRKGTIALTDFATGVTRMMAFDRRCFLQDGSRGFFLLNCETDRGLRAPFILHARRATLQRAAGDYDVRAESFGRIGRYWLQGTHHGEGHPAVEYLNWRTGERFVDGSFEDPRPPRDLNSRNARPLGPPTDVPQAFAAGPYVVSIGSRNRWPYSGPVLLRRRGHRTRTLDRCPRGCSLLSAGAGLATWLSGPKRARAYALRTRHRKTWALPRAGTAVAHTKQRVFFSRPAVETTFDPYSARSGPYTIFAVTAPR